MSKANKKNTTTALVPASNNSLKVYQLEGTDVDLAGFKSLRVPIVKPREMPIGSFVIGEIKAIVDSPVKEYKSQLLHMIGADEVEFKFPITATIKRALEPDANEFVGKTILIKKTGEAQGKTGKKMIHLFDVAVREE